MDDFAGLAVALFVVLALLAALVLRANWYWVKYDGVRHERVRLDDAALKPGDLVLFVAHVHSMATSVFACNFYSHCGVVVDLPNGALGLSETTPESGRPTCRPLLERLHEGGAACFAMRLETPLDAAARRKLTELAGADSSYPTLLTALGAAVGLPSQRRHCMQHVAHILNGLLADGEIDVSFYGSPNAIERLPGRELAAGNRYLPPVELSI